MKTHVFICGVLMLSLSSCDQEPLPVAQSPNGHVLETLSVVVQCKNEFQSTLSTIASNASSLNAQQRLSFVLDAVERRRRCDDRAFETLQAQMDAERRILER